MSSNPAFTVALVLGSLMLACVCYVYVRHQVFGIGGSALSGLGVVLIGMSVWKTVDVAFDEKGVRAKLEQVETVAKRAESTAVQAQNESKTNRKIAESLQSTIETAFLQEKLKAVGLYSSPADGYMGPATRAALKRFQQSKGLAATGDLNQETKKLLDIKALPEEGALTK